MAIDGIKPTGNTPSKSDIPAPAARSEQKPAPAPETKAPGDSSSISDEAYEVPDSDKNNYVRIGTDDAGKSFIDSWNIEENRLASRSGGRSLTVDENSYHRKELSEEDLENLQINTGDGNDYVEVLDATGKPMTINLGEGNDLADAMQDFAEGEDVKINGGGGDDTIFSNGVIDGGEGTDSVLPETDKGKASNVEEDSKAWDGNPYHEHTIDKNIGGVTDTKGNEV